MDQQNTNTSTGPLVETTAIPTDFMAAHRAAEERKPGPIRAYFIDTGEILLSPSKFFRERFEQFTLGEAFTVALVALWSSAIISFCWETLNTLMFTQLLEVWVQKLVPDLSLFHNLPPNAYVMQAGWVVLTPFSGALRLLFSGFLLFFFSKLFISSQKNLTYTNSAKIVAFAAMGSWFSVIPFFGDLLAFFASLILGVIGVKEVFAVSARRASAIVLAPQILFGLAILLVLLFVFGLALSLPMEELLQQLQGMPGDASFWSEEEEAKALQEGLRACLQFLF